MLIVRTKKINKMSSTILSKKERIMIIYKDHLFHVNIESGSKLSLAWLQ